MLRLGLCLLLLSLPAWGWGIKKELLQPQQRKLCLTYKALHNRRIRYRLVQDSESRRRFPSEQMHAEIAAALKLWCEPLGNVRLLRSSGACDLQVEFVPTPAGDTSNGAFTALASHCVRVRINIDHIFHETRSLPGNPNGDYPWQPFPSLRLPGSHQNLGDVAQQPGRRSRTAACLTTSRQPTILDDVRIVARVLFVLNLSLAWAEPPLSPPASARQALESSQMVFVGKVVSVKKDKLGFDSLAQVEVVKSIRGKLAPQVQVSGEGGPTHPARIFRAGQTWLFYLGSDLHADSYSNRVVPENQIEADLQSLRRKPMTGQIPEPGDR